jgi:ribosomal protein L37E
MALIKCPECGRENVSDTAESCPDCGYGIKEHFAEIERQKELEKIRIENEKRKEEQQRKQREKEEAELDAIKMPSKPRIWQYLLMFGIIFVPFMLLGLILPYRIGFWFF